MELTVKEFKEIINYINEIIEYNYDRDLNEIHNHLNHLESLIEDIGITHCSNNQENKELPFI